MNVWNSIYAEDRWGGGSGPGSKAETTVEYRAFIEWFICEHSISDVIDIGCGDGVIASLIEWGDTSYHGVDVSSDAIGIAKSHGRIDPVRFRVGSASDYDVVSRTELHYTLAVVKDVFQHLPFAKIREVLNSLKGFQHILVTNDIPTSSEVHDCKEGDWRPIDITLPPLNVTATEVLRFQSSPLMKKTVHIQNFK